MMIERECGPLQTFRPHSVPWHIYLFHLQRNKQKPTVDSLSTHYGWQSSGFTAQDELNNIWMESAFIFILSFKEWLSHNFGLCDRTYLYGCSEIASRRWTCHICKMKTKYSDKRLTKSASTQHTWNFIDFYHYQQQSGLAWASFLPTFEWE